MNILLSLQCVHISRSQGNISFNESGLCVGTNEDNNRSINVGLLKTPVSHKTYTIEGGDFEDNSPTSFPTGPNSALSMTTPLALRDISNKAQRELAMLYSPCPEEDEESPEKEENEANVNANN